MEVSEHDELAHKKSTEPIFHRIPPQAQTTLCAAITRRLHVRLMRRGSRTSIGWIVHPLINLASVAPQRSTGQSSVECFSERDLMQALG